MLKKELIELCLLQLICQGDQYGYQLLRRLHEAFPDTQESGIYAILRELCRAGCTQQYQGETSDGPARKYYRLTPTGERRRTGLLDQWRRLRDALAEMGVT